MKVVIIEDEKLAINKLKRLLNEIDSTIGVLTQLNSVEEAVNWFLINEMPDLIFMDIQLEDGICFEIFENVTIRTPIIFTTAFDQYALTAFKQNSVDYLLKPINKDELENALVKFNSIHFNPNKFIEKLATKRKERFLVKIGDRYRSIQTSDISMFFIEEKCNFLRTFKGKNFAIDYSLEKLETLLDSRLFNRINRTTIINYHAIDEIVAYSNSRLKLKLINSLIDGLLVSRERVPAFKEWMNR